MDRNNLSAKAIGVKEDIFAEEYDKWTWPGSISNLKVLTGNKESNSNASLDHGHKPIGILRPESNIFPRNASSSSDDGGPSYFEDANKLFKTKSFRKRNLSTGSEDQNADGENLSYGPPPLPNEQMTFGIDSANAFLRSNTKNSPENKEYIASYETNFDPLHDVRNTDCHSLSRSPSAQRSTIGTDNPFTFGSRSNSQERSSTEQKSLSKEDKTEASKQLVSEAKTSSSYKSRSRSGSRDRRRTKRSRSRSKKSRSRSRDRRRDRGSRHGSRGRDRHSDRDRKESSRVCRRSRSKDRHSRSRSYDRRRDRDRRRRRSRSRDRYYRRRRSHSRSHSRDRSKGRSGSSNRKPGSLPLSSSGGAMTPQMALQQTMAAMSAKAQAMTGIALPKYYNPAAVNPLKYAEQVQKRKLLWQPKEKVEDTSKNSVWDKLTFAQDNDGKMTAKFRKLMGIKSEGGSSKEEEEAPPEDGVLKKQEELFRDLDQQYEMARVTTHTQRGVGLGYSAQTVYPPVQK